jgi:3-oxoacyl-[acyl-carrier-protein] synthase II
VPHPQGRGAEAAVRAALADAGCAPGDIVHINAHGSSTPYNDLAEARLIRRLFPQGPPVTANKSVIGHGLGAAGAVEAAITVLSLGHGVVPPTANLDGQDLDLELDVVVKAPRAVPQRTALSTSFGFGGHNAALVLRTA